MSRANPFSLLSELGDEEPDPEPERKASSEQGARKHLDVGSRLVGRRWLTSPVPPPSCPSGWSRVPLRLVSYNVLAKCYAKQVHFPRCNPDHLRWEGRRKALVEVIQELEADIVCLQEVDNYEKFWEKEMRRLGFAGVYKQRNSASKRDGCATFFRADKFEKVHSQSIEFDDLNTAESENMPDFKTHNVAQLTLLRPLAAKCASFCVGNAHLFWDPSYEELKSAQARCLSETARETLAQLDPAAPLLLAGDFNSVPTSEVYRFLTHDAHLNSAYVACGGYNNDNAPPQLPIPSSPPPSAPSRESSALSPPATPPAPPSPPHNPTPPATPPPTLAPTGAGVAAPPASLYEGPGKRESAGRASAGQGPGLVLMRPLNPNSPVFSPHSAPSPSGAGGGEGGQRRAPGTAPGREPAFTNFRDIFQGTIDYMLLSGPDRASSRGEVAALACLSMISEAEARYSGGGLPNRRHPSDHLPIAADLALLLPPQDKPDVDADPR